MQLEAGLPIEVVESKFLANHYMYSVYYSLRDKVSKDFALKSLKHERENAICFMRNKNIPEEKIKIALKNAADERKKELALIGITPELLY